MLLRMGLLLRLGPNVITDGTFITLGSNYDTCAFYGVVKYRIVAAVGIDTKYTE